MLLFSEFLIEIKAPEVNIAIRLLNDMPDDARRAITSWEFSQWVTGDLEKAYKSKNSTWSNVEEYADILRQSIRKQHGNKITLYRGIVKGETTDLHKNRVLHSWTSRKEIAAVFSGLATSVGGKNVELNKNKVTSNEALLSLSDAEAKDIQDKVMKTGKAVYKNYLFKTSSINKDYFEMYRKKGSQYSFFADDKKDKLAAWLIRTRDEEKQFKLDINSAGQDSGYVVVDQIPVDDIVWVLNNGKYSGTLEYIVKGNSGMNSKKIKI